MTAGPKIRIVRGASALSARPLFGGVRVLRGRVIDDLSTFQADMDAALAEAERRGYEDGISSTVRQLAAAERVYEGARSRAERDLVDLAFGLAEQVLSAALDRDRFIGLVQSQVTGLASRGTIVVHVAPEYAEVVLAPVDGVDVVVRPDASLVPGDCVIETDGGSRDGRLSVRFEALRRALGAP